MRPAMHSEDDDIQPMFDDAIRRLRLSFEKRRFQTLQRKLTSGLDLTPDERQEYRMLLRKK